MTPTERHELVTRAQALVTRCNGMEEAGMPEAAREIRHIATGLLTTIDQLESEQSARRALQTRCDQLQAIVGKAVYQACATHDDDIPL